MCARKMKNRIRPSVNFITSSSTRGNSLRFQTCPWEIKFSKYCRPSQWSLWTESWALDVQTQSSIQVQPAVNQGQIIQVHDLPKFVKAQPICTKKLFWANLFGLVPTQVSHDIFNEPCIWAHRGGCKVCIDEAQDPFHSKNLKCSMMCIYMADGSNDPQVYM